MISCLALALALALCARGEVVATARSPEGKFGEFRVVLDAVGAPVAVANFMGLVDGSQAWMDTEEGWVRGGEGDAFYDGMVFDWNAESVLRGGLRGVMGTNGTVAYTGEPGYTIRSEVGASGWNAVEEGSLALVERIPSANGVLTAELQGWLKNEVDVMHSGGGEVGLFLTNGMVPWTVFGHVPVEDKEGLRQLAAAVAEEPAEVRWEVDAARMTEAERAALETARTELPSAHDIETRLNATGPEWTWSGKSRLWYTLSTNLMAGWHYLNLWNEGTGSSTLNVAWANLGWREPDGNIVALERPQGFASFAEVEYPAMGGEPLSGKWKIGVEHTGQAMQYWLDFNGNPSGGTGIWAKVEGTNVTEVGRVSGVFSQRETGNSICIRFFLGMSIRFYWFGVEKEGVTEGWFQEVQVEVDEGGKIYEDSGPYEWTRGWGEAAPRAPAWTRAGYSGGGASGDVLVPSGLVQVPKAPLEMEGKRTGPIRLKGTKEGI